MSSEHEPKDHEPQVHKPQPQLPDANDPRDRRSANIFLLVAAAVFIGIGIWLVNAMVDARRADECLSSGRRNCSPIEVPQR